MHAMAWRILYISHCVTSQYTGLSSHRANRDHPVHTMSKVICKLGRAFQPRAVRRCACSSHASKPVFKIFRHAHAMFSLCLSGIDYYGRAKLKLPHYAPAIPLCNTPQAEVLTTDSLDVADMHTVCLGIDSTALQMYASQMCSRAQPRNSRDLDHLSHAQPCAI